MLPQTTQRVATLSDPVRGIVDPIVLDQEYSTPCLRGFTVTVAGDVAVLYDDGSQGVLPSREVGVDYGGMIRKILSAGTTATGIKGYR